MRASASGHPDVVQLLLSAGVSLDETDKVSKSLLYYIASSSSSGQRWLHSNELKMDH